MKLQKTSELIVILGTGGTIAGTAAVATDNIGYRAAQLSVAELTSAIPAFEQHALELEQVAQLDSKDMAHEVWRLLAQRIAHHLSRDEVGGVVVTHGTDTLEETAYFLHRVLGTGAKPIVLTAAMRPASSLQADGPQNLLDAVELAGTSDACGVLVALAGRVHSAERVSKRHSYRIDAFASGDDGLIAVIEDGRVRRLNAWPQGQALGLGLLEREVKTWPHVDVVMSHAGADGRIVEALVLAGTQGIVVAGTGNGTLHHSLEAALAAAHAQGVTVWRCTRCADGSIVGNPAGAWPAVEGLNAAKTRVALLLHLLAREQH